VQNEAEKWFAPKRGQVFVSIGDISERVSEAGNMQDFTDGGATNEGLEDPGHPDPPVEFKVSHFWKGKPTSEKRLWHQRIGHMSVDGLGCDGCEACDIGKAQRTGHSKQRDVKYSAKDWLDCVDWDFKGPITPVSFMRMKWLLNAVDQHTSWLSCYPCASKKDAAQCLEKFISLLGRPKRVRTDNDPIFKGENSGWRQLLRKFDPCIFPLYSAPYHPQMNGKIERFNRTISNALRAMLYGVDSRFWDYAAEYFAYIYNRLDRKSGQKSPFYKKEGRDPSIKHLKRFGCLCLPRIQGLNESALATFEPKREQAVFLGFADCTSGSGAVAFCGVWRKDDRRTDKLAFTVIECRDVKFREEIMISDVDDLKKKVTLQVVTAESVNFALTAVDYTLTLRLRLSSCFGLWFEP
jgi:hypothetical protein